MLYEICKLKFKDNQSAYIIAWEATQAAESSFSKHSIEYAKWLKQKAEIKTILKDFQNAYWDWLDMYEISKALFETDVNEISNDAIFMMSSIKMYLYQFNDAKNLINKWKLIEQKISSNSSNRYKETLRLEQIIYDKEKEYNQRNPRLIKTSSIFKSLSPNTPLKFTILISAIAAASVGILYYFKKKSS